MWIEDISLSQRKSQHCREEQRDTEGNESEHRRWGVDVLATETAVGEQPSNIIQFGPFSLYIFGKKKSCDNQVREHHCNSQTKVTVSRAGDI